MSVLVLPHRTCIITTTSGFTFLRPCVNSEGLSAKTWLEKEAVAFGSWVPWFPSTSVFLTSCLTLGYLLMLVASAPFLSRNQKSLPTWLALCFIYVPFRDTENILLYEFHCWKLMLLFKDLYFVYIIHAGQGRQHCQAWGSTGGRICQTRSPPSHLFQWCMFHSSHSAFQFQEVQLSRTMGSTEWFLLTQECPLTHPSWWGIPLQIPVDNASPGMMELGVLSGTAHWSTMRAGAMAVSYNFQKVLSVRARIPSLACGATGPTGWSSNIKPWGSTLVHKVMEVLFVSSLICCFNIPFFLSSNPTACRL